MLDISGDGKLDVVTGNTSDNTASVLLGNGDGTFQTEIDTPPCASLPLQVSPQ